VPDGVEIAVMSPLFFVVAHKSPAKMGRSWGGLICEKQFSCNGSSLTARNVTLNTTKG